MCLSQAKHANGEHSWGINGETGKIVDMKEYGLYESASVKVRPFPCVSSLLPLSHLLTPLSAYRCKH